MTNVLLLVFPVIFARAATPSVRHTCRSYQRHHTVPSARSSSHARLLVRAGLAAAAPLQTDTLLRTTSWPRASSLVSRRRGLALLWRAFDWPGPSPSLRCAAAAPPSPSGPPCSRQDEEEDRGRRCFYLRNCHSLFNLHRLVVLTPFRVVQVALDSYHRVLCSSANTYYVTRL